MIKALMQIFKMVRECPRCEYLVDPEKPKCNQGTACPFRAPNKPGISDDVRMGDHIAGDPEGEKF